MLPQGQVLLSTAFPVAFPFPALLALLFNNLLGLPLPCIFLLTTHVFTNVPSICIFPFYALLVSFSPPCIL